MAPSSPPVPSSTHDVPAYAVVAGNPARPVKRRFPPDIVSALELVAWWNWPVEKISRNLQHIVAGDIEALLKLHEDGAKPPAP